MPKFTVSFTVTTAEPLTAEQTAAIEEWAGLKVDEFGSDITACVDPLATEWAMTTDDYLSATAAKFRLGTKVIARLSDGSELLTGNVSGVVFASGGGRFGWMYDVAEGNGTRTFRCWEDELSPVEQEADR
jgi:hypothetical protein